MDTVKSLKHPDKKMYITLTLAIFGVVIATGLYFVLADWLFSNVYQAFYDFMTPEAI
ncbi:preprotein translocase subunit SecE [bacterium]|nr:preprotein translocase subunit SecE [bacterium]